MMRRYAIRALLGGLIAAAAGLPAQATPAQYGLAELEQNDIEPYMQSLTDGFRSCEAEWLARQFLPGATVQVVHADGKREVFSPGDHEKLSAYYCRPHQAVKREARGRYSYYSTGGAATVVRWTLGWSGQETTVQGNPQVVFEEWAELVKQGYAIRIARCGAQVREVARGAEAEFYARTQAGGLYPLYKVSAAFSETMARLFEGIKRLARGTPRGPNPQHQAKAEGYVFAP